MRINIYHHELKFMEKRIEHVQKVTDAGNHFHGFRMYTEAPFYHDGPDDDDSSAITIWVPWTAIEGHDTKQLRGIALQLTQFCDDVDRQSRTES